MKFNKKTCLTILSLLLTTIVIILGMPFEKTDCYGDMLLRYVGLNPWSNGKTGLHYTFFICLALLISAYILWRKAGNNLLDLWHNFEYKLLIRNDKRRRMENLESIRRIQTLECKLSILITMIISFVLPGKLIQNDSLLKYAFGFPCEYLFVYQGEKGSFQLFNNLFNGNDGMNINIVGLFFDIVIYYYVVLLIRNIYTYCKKKFSLK